jgi:hypothetical protein
MRPAPATNDIFEVVVAGHQVVLCRHLGRVSEPLRHDVRRITLHPVGRARSPEVLQKTWPQLVASLGDNPLQMGPQIDSHSGGHWHDQPGSRLGLLERIGEQDTQFRADRHNSDRMVGSMVLRLLRPHH